LNNHDVKRAASRYGAGSMTEARARILATMLFTLRGTPFMYYGEEIGMREGNIPRAEIMDPPGRRYWPFYKGRDGCRTPMQWSAEPHAGFSPAKPWMRVNSDFKHINVQAQQENPDSLLSYYHKLITLRRESPALQRGTYRSPAHPIGIWAYERATDEQRMWIVINFFSYPGEMKIAGSWRVRLSTVDRHEAVIQGMIPLAPNEAVILEAV
jgi:alpha-glucosidase